MPGAATRSMDKRHGSKSRMERGEAYRPVVALVRLDGNGGALAVHEVIRVVDVLETAGTDNGVNMGAVLGVERYLQSTTRMTDNCRFYSPFQSSRSSQGAS